MKVEEIAVEQPKGRPADQPLKGWRVTFDADDIKYAILERLYRCPEGTERETKWEVTGLADLAPESPSLPPSLVFIITAPHCAWDCPFTAETQRDLLPALGKLLRDQAAKPSPIDMAK